MHGPQLPCQCLCVPGICLALELDLECDLCPWYWHYDLRTSSHCNPPTHRPGSPRPTSVLLGPLGSRQPGLDLFFVFSSFKTVPFWQCPVTHLCCLFGGWKWTDRWTQKQQQQQPQQPASHTPADKNFGWQTSVELFIPGKTSCWYHWHYMGSRLIVEP